MTFDVLISHSSADKALSQTICERFEAAGLRCWIAPRNIAPGAEWAGAIIDGINASRLMVLVFSEGSNTSRHVQREILYATENKLPILPFRIERLSPTGGLAYCLMGLQWLDAWAVPAEQCIDALIARVRMILGELDRHPGSLAPLDAANPAVAAISGQARGFDPAELAKIADRLGHSLGPIAAHLVKTTAASAATLDDLRRALAEHIADKNERALFLDTFNPADKAQPSSPVGGVASAAKPAPVWSADVLKRVKSELADYLGPVAGVLVERAAKEAASPQELYERLAVNLHLPKEREKWLKAGAAFRI